MSKIMVRGPADSIFGVHQHANCPALDFQKARDRRHAQVHEENKVRHAEYRMHTCINVQLVRACACGRERGLLVTIVRDCARI